VLRSFAGATADQILAHPERVRLKHALALVATEAGFESWLEMKAALERPDNVDQSWYARGMDVFLNRWFRTYEEARRSLDEDGGFLLTYRKQFFICEDAAIPLLGLDPRDPDWERIGWDCARPIDKAAYERLSRGRRLPVTN
jgi:hypothetical protein